MSGVTCQGQLGSLPHPGSIPMAKEVEESMKRWQLPLQLRVTVTERHISPKENEGALLTAPSTR